MKAFPIMKIALFTFMAIHVFSQGANWEVVPLPAKSTVNILAQSPDGVLFGSNTNELGNIISYDHGLTWNYTSKNVNIYPHSVYSFGFKDEIFVYRFPKIYKHALSTGQTDTIAVPSTRTSKKIFPTNFTFGLTLLSDNKLYLINNTGIVQVSFSGDIKWVGTSAYDNKAYIISKNGSKHFISRINADGSVSPLGETQTSTGQFFLYKSTIIRNTEYSADEGKTWAQYNLPFTVPDTIVTYKGNLAFVKDNQVFYKEGNQSTFSIVTLPAGIKARDILIGQTIVIPFKNSNIEKPKILRETNGTFEPLECNLETFITRDFLPTRDGGIFATDENFKLYYKQKNAASWTALHQTVSHSTGSGNKLDNLSVNKSGSVSLLNKNRSLYVSNDEGVTWIKQPEFDSLIWHNKHELFNGTYMCNSKNIWLKTPWSDTWVHVDTVTEQNFSGFMSNADVYYKEDFFIEQVYADNLRKNNFFRILDIKNYRYKLYPHYEMNYMYNFSSELIPNTRWKYKLILSHSYDNGADFEEIETNLPEDVHVFEMRVLSTGHLLIYYFNKAFLSADYGKTWKETDLNLDPDDIIRGAELSLDNYLYLNTRKHGVLKNIHPLPQANIVRIQLLQDAQGDCQSGNDTEGAEGIRLSMGQDIHQLTNHEGRASFYTFDQQTMIVLQDKSGIFDFCQDTIWVDFDQPAGSIDSITINVRKTKTCADLSLSFETHADSLTLQNNSYYLVVQNNGNATSEPTRVIFTPDPHLFDFALNWMDTLTRIDETTYAIPVDSIQPGTVKTYMIGHRINPEVSPDYNICSSVYLENTNNQCQVQPSKFVCRYPNKQGKENTIRIRFFEDKNQNCAKDPDEIYVHENINICADSQDVVVRGDSVLYYVTGKKEVNLIPLYNKDLYTLCENQYNVIVPDTTTNVHLDIPVKEIKRCPVLYSSMSSGRYIRCFDTHLQYYLHNRGNALSKSGVVRINIDDYFEVSSVTPAPAQIDGNTYIFNVNPLNPGTFMTFRFECKISCNAALGQTHCHTMELNENNASCFLNAGPRSDCNINGGSYDPNDKTIFVSGNENETAIAADDEIEYRIRFQNTGTDTAYNVKIHDYLSKKFDVSSIRFIHATHTCTWKVDNRVLIVEFPDIDLVDSFTNAVGSQGEIRFSIGLLSGIKPGDVFANQANIFFDFNEPIATNKVVSTFGIPTGVKNIPDKLVCKLTFYPNPSAAEVQIMGLSPTEDTDIFMFNNLGQLILVTTIKAGHNLLMVDGIAPGIYQVIARERNKMKAGKLVKM